MAGQWAGCASCAALPSSAIPPFGVSAVLRSGDQSVADRRGRRPGRAALRLGLRTLVVGGIAGAAWLLSAAAAHAAEPETPTDAANRGLSVFSLVSDLGTGVVEESAPSLVGELLTPAAEVDAALPLDHLLGTGATARNDTSMPARQPVEADVPAPSRTYTPEPAAPLRLTGGPIGSMDSDARDAEPAGSDALPGVALSRGLGDLTIPVGTAAVPAEPSGFETDSTASSEQATDPTPVTPIPGIAAASTTPVRASASAAVTGTWLGPEPERAARPAPDAEPSPLVDARPDVPEQPPGALPPVSVTGAAGGASRAPTGGSGITTDGSSFTVDSAVVMGTMGAASRPAAPADVVVPRCDAEAPTVSPD